MGNRKDTKGVVRMKKFADRLFFFSLGVVFTVVGSTAYVYYTDPVFRTLFWMVWNETGTWN